LEAHKAYEKAEREHREFELKMELERKQADLNDTQVE
jgi:hypothetical protein